MWNSSISTWQRLNTWTMLYERPSTINLPWKILTPIMSACAFRGGMRDRRRKVTQILGTTRGNCYTGVARNPHRVCRRRSRALFSNTSQQRTCLHRSYKHAHKSYNIDRWTPSLRTTLRLIHHRMTTPRLEHEPLLSALSRTLLPSRHHSSGQNSGRRRHQIL
jgi:hypothetical protein